jgi:hypothetical protein
MVAKTETSLLDYLAKAAVLLPEEDVVVPEWDGRTVTLRGWSSRERDSFEEDSLTRAQRKAGNGAGKGRGQQKQISADLVNFRARLVSRTIVENGVRTFASVRGEEMLGDQPATVLDRLFTVAQRLHGMSDRDVEDLLGNGENDSGEITESGSSSFSAEASTGPMPN